MPDRAGLTQWVADQARLFALRRRGRARAWKRRSTGYRAEALEQRLLLSGYGFDFPGEVVPEYAAGSSPRSVAAADLDGDGDADLVAANYIATGTVSVLRNFGNAGTPVIAGTAGNDAFTVRLNAAGDAVEVYLDASPTPLATYPLATAPQIVFQGLGGDDILRIDRVHGDPVPTAGLRFAGGAGTDELRLIDDDDDDDDASDWSLSPGSAPGSSTSMPRSSASTPPGCCPSASCSTARWASTG